MKGLSRPQFDYTPRFGTESREPSTDWQLSRRGVTDRNGKGQTVANGHYVLPVSRLAVWTLYPESALPGFLDDDDRYIDCLALMRAESEVVVRECMNEINAPDGRGVKTRPINLLSLLAATEQYQAPLWLFISECAS